MDIKDKIIEEMAKDLEYRTSVVEYRCEKDCHKCNYAGFKDAKCPSYVLAKTFYNAGYRKLPENSVVLSREELKRLETNYKIGLGKSQSWCKSLKNRIEELEKENFKLKVDNEVLKEEKEQFENDVCNYEMNLQHLTGELENKGKETAEKILFKIESEFAYYDNEDMFSKKAIFECLEEIVKSCGVEIKE